MINPTTASLFIPKAAERHQPCAKAPDGNPKPQVSPLILAAARSGYARIDASVSPPAPVIIWNGIPRKKLLIAWGVVLAGTVLAHIVYKYES